MTTEQIREIKGHRRFLAITMAVAILVVTLFSSVYIIKEADHDCTGSSCPVCAMIEQCEDTLKLVGAGVLLTLMGIATVDLFCHIFSTFNHHVPMGTLVTQKVRMNN